jgi:hypothetical protein
VAPHRGGAAGPTPTELGGQVSWLLGQGKLEPRWGHLAGDLPSPVSLQREKRPHVGKRFQPAILLGAQDGDHRASFGSQRGQKLRGHAFPINNQATERSLLRRRFIPREEAWGAQGQVQIAAMGRSQERMPPLVM